MRSYGISEGIYEKIYRYSNFVKALNEAAKGKTGRKTVKMAFMNKRQVYTDIVLHRYSLGIYTKETIVDFPSMKTRNILIPPFVYDQIFHHMVMRVIEPYLQRREYAYSCSGKKVKGVIYAKNVLQSMVRGDPKGTRYSIQLDVRHFYDSIDHAILKKMLAKVFRDKRVLDILGEIIDTTQIGLPLGCYPSQELANFYLDSVDHYLKETMRVRHLIRYCDNIEILDGSRRKLLLAKAVIGSMLKSKLNVSIHGNEEVIRVAYDDKSGAIVGERIDFVGYQVCRGWTRIRKRNFKYLRRTALRVMGFIRKGTKIPKSLARRLMSMKGEADNSDSEKIKRMYLYPTLKAARKAVALG